MRVYVGIATTGRSGVLEQTIQCLADQSVAPGAVFICTPVSEPLSISSCLTSASIAMLSSEKGSCIQRNVILDHLGGAEGVLLFTDDDFFLHSRYVENVARLFSLHPDIVLASGTILKDGITGPGLSPEEAHAILALNKDRECEPILVEDCHSAYGCNMAVNLALVGTTRFDEALPLYGWQEDVDFSERLKCFGRVVKTNQLAGVHLGVKTGRTAGRKFGYSQVANPIYLWRKGTMRLGHALGLVARNVLMNLVRSIRPEPYIDRRGRLRGNLKAFSEVLLRRIDPRRVLRV